MPSSAIDARSSAARSGLLPVTTRARFPISAARGAACRNVPGPKSTLPAVAKSNCIWLTPGRIVREDVVVHRARPGLGHHLPCGLLPGLVVGGLAMLRRIVGRAIDLDQDEPRRVVVLLDDVETRDPRLAHAVAGVLDGRGTEGLHRFGPNVDENVHDVHGSHSFRQMGAHLAPGPF